MRARPFVFTSFACLVAGVTVGTACIPDPKGDFEDYQERVKDLGGQVGGGDGGGGGFDSAPPTQAVSGLYAGGCLSQLAFNRVERAFSFVAETQFTPDGATGKLTLKLTALRLVDGKPPPTYTAAGKSGGTQGNPEPATPNVDASGKYTVELGTVTVPGDANPITGRDVVIEQTSLVGRFANDRFCARLNGNVTQPVQVALDPPRNICHFLPVKDGDPLATATFAAEQFAADTCPE